MDVSGNCWAKSCRGGIVWTARYRSTHGGWCYCLDLECALEPYDGGEGAWREGAFQLRAVIEAKDGIAEVIFVNVTTATGGMTSDPQKSSTYNPKSLECLGTRMIFSAYVLKVWYR